MSAERDDAIQALEAALDQELSGYCLNLCDGNVEFDTDPEDILTNLEARGWTITPKQDAERSAS